MLTLWPSKQGRDSTYNHCRYADPAEGRYRPWGASIRTARLQRRGPPAGTACLSRRTLRLTRRSVRLAPHTRRSCRLCLAAGKHERVHLIWQKLLSLQQYYEASSACTFCGRQVQPEPRMQLVAHLHVTSVSQIPRDKHEC